MSTTARPLTGLAGIVFATAAVVAFLSAGRAASAQDPPSGAPPSIVLTGTAVAPGLREPVAGVRIAVVGPAGVVAEAETAADGRWQAAVAAVPPRVDVWAVAPDGRTSVHATERRDVRPAWDVGPSDVDRPATIVVRATSVDAAGAPGSAKLLAGAQVTIDRDRTANVLGPSRTVDLAAPAMRVASRTIDADGATSFIAVPGGPWIATLRRAGDVCGWAFVDAVPGRETTVNLVARPTAPLAVRLFGRAGDPQPGVTLVCAPAPDVVGPVLMSASTTATTGADGVARFASVPAGLAVLFESTGDALVPTDVLRAPLRGDAAVPVARVVRVPVRGYVLDEATGEPIADADVLVTSRRLEIPFEFRRRTDAGGAFDMPLPADASYPDVRASAAGFVPSREGPTRVQPGTHERIEAGTVFVAGMRRAEVVTGLVRGPDGPVAGATVIIFVQAAMGNEPTCRGVTDAAGQYAIDVPAGAQWSVDAHSLLYPGTAVRRGDDATPRTTLTLAPGLRVTGRVVGDDGAPLPWTWVGWERKTVRTDAEGRFAMRRDMTRPRPGGVPDRKPPVPTDWVLLPTKIPGGGTRPGDVDLGTIRSVLGDGTLRLPAQAATAFDARVVLSGRPDVPIFGTAERSSSRRDAGRTAGDGPSLLLKPQADAARVVVAFERGGRAPAFAEATVAASPDGGGTAEMVGAHDVVVQVDDAEGAPRPGVSVSVRMIGWGPRAGPRDGGIHVIAFAPEVRAVTDENGRATLADLPPGSYSVGFHAPGVESGDVPLDVPAKAPVSVVLGATRTVTGRIVLARTGEPIRGARIDILQRIGEVGRDALAAATDADGRFRLDGAPDVATGIVVRPGLDCSLSFLPATVHLSGADIDGATIRVRPGLEIAGRVVDADGRPIPFARIAAFQRDAEQDLQRAWTTSGLDGSFRVIGLVRGTWSLTVEHPRFAGRGSRQIPTDVPAGAKAVELRP